MKTAVTVVIELNLNKPMPWDKNEESAFNKIRDIVNTWAGLDVHCEGKGRHAIVLDAQRDSGTVAALLHWCECGKFAYKAHWFTDGWSVQGN